jgi:hypothetical protein
MVLPDGPDERDGDEELDRRSGDDEFRDHGPYFGA